MIRPDGSAIAMLLTCRTPSMRRRQQSAHLRARREVMRLYSVHGVAQDEIHRLDRAAGLLRQHHIEARHLQFRIADDLDTRHLKLEGRHRSNNRRRAAEKYCSVRLMAGIFVSFGASAFGFMGSSCAGAARRPDASRALEGPFVLHLSGGISSTSWQREITRFFPPRRFYFSIIVSQFASQCQHTPVVSAAREDKDAKIKADVLPLRQRSERHRVGLNPAGPPLGCAGPTAPLPFGAKEMRDGRGRSALRGEGWDWPRHLQPSAGPQRDDLRDVRPADPNLRRGRHGRLPCACSS